MSLVKEAQELYGQQKAADLVGGKANIRAERYAALLEARKKSGKKGTAVRTLLSAATGGGDTPKPPKQKMTWKKLQELKANMQTAT